MTATRVLLTQVAELTLELPNTSEALVSILTRSLPSIALGEAPATVLE